jgi:hypothetical protein
LVLGCWCNDIYPTRSRIIHQPATSIWWRVHQYLNHQSPTEFEQGLRCLMMRSIVKWNCHWYVRKTIILCLHGHGSSYSLPISAVHFP